MSVRYICTQCEQFFIVGDGAGVAVNCLSCGGMAFPAAEPDGEEAQAPLNREEDGAGSHVRDIHDEETDILETSDERYRERTEVLPAREIVPDADEAAPEHEEGTAAGVGEESGWDDFSSYPSEESAPYPHPDEQSAPSLAGPSLPSSLWGTENHELYESERSSLPFDESQDSDAFDESDLFESGDFELEAMHALDNAFGAGESQEHSHFEESGEENYEPHREKTDPSARPYALRRGEGSDFHLTLSEEVQAIAGISLDSHSERAGLPIPDDDTERVPRARRTADAMPRAKEVAWQRDRERNAGPAEVSPARPVDDAPQLASPNYNLPPRSRLVALAAACLVLGFGLGFVQTEGPVDQRSPLVRDAETRLVEGNRAFADGELERALGHYRSALALQPNYPEAVYARAVVLARQKRFEEAAAAYREYVELAPEGLYADAVRQVLSVYTAKK